MRRLLSRDGLLFAESVTLLALIRLALVVVPFRTVLRVVDRVSSPATGHAPTSGEIDLVQWAVLRAGRCVPGGGHCLTRALTAKILFGRKDRAVVLRIGVAKDEGGRLVAHAWLESDGAPIFGATDSDIRQYSLLPQLNRA